MVFATEVPEITDWRWQKLGNGTSYISYLSSCHAVVEILLWSNPCEKPSIYEPSCAWTGVVGKEGGEEGATGHQGGTLPLQLNLTKQA